MAEEKEGVEVRFRLSEEAYGRLEEIAEARGWGMPTLMRKVLAAFVFVNNIVYEDPERELLLRKGTGAIRRTDDIRKIFGF